MIPIFKSEYSLGKSILTLDKIKDKIDESHAISIGTIAKVHNLQNLYIVDDSMTGFLKAYKICEDLKINLRFGLRLSVVANGNDKSENSLSTSSKIIIFIKNTEGYKDLLKIHNQASIDFFYYEKRTDWESLREKWTENLILVYPFFDSFLYKNTLTDARCIPDDSFTPSFFFDESHHGLPFCDLIKSSLNDYVPKQEYKDRIIKSHSVYYYSKKCFPAFHTYKCINNRSNLSCPKLNNFSCDDFSFESWLTFNK